MVVSAGLLAARGWFALRDEELRKSRYIFEQLERQELIWDSELLSIQLGFARNYDEITAIARNMEVGWRNLYDFTSTSDSLKILTPRVSAYRAGLERKIWLSEQIKASYAMLRNSVSVLPDAVRLLYSEPKAFSPLDGTGIRISDMTTEVITDTIAFTASPTRPNGDALRQRVTRTRSYTSTLPPETAKVLLRLLAQVDVVIKERQRGNELMLALNAVPSGAASEDLDDELQAIERKNVEQKNLVRNMGVLIGAVLLVVAANWALTLRKRFVMLRNDNWLLHQLNENTEQQLLQSAKLSTVGQMVAGISHEINTPLAYVKAVFELIKERVTARPYLAFPENAAELASDRDRENREELAQLLEDGLHGLEEMTAFVTSMKNFSRLDKVNVESFSVTGAIESALQIAAHGIRSDIEIRREFDPVPPINGSSSQLRQVFINLIVNAIDALTDKKDQPRLTLRVRHTVSDTVQIEVGDNGKGIDEEHLGKVFDPFFTTKQVGQGTGMGLSISYRIIENHGGTITVLSKPGKGTVFTITLPRQDDRDFSTQST